ncbi:MAG TPA: DUF2249 domain-containing protein [Ktedonosporobacter sp.]|jgi:uncharacterized protein (DUF2249 family)|nr:DUF2249 domain-containing protein [Ktedonosporobacter sp.]
MAEQTATLDVRTIPPRERHPLIFSRLDALQVGEALLLVNDHDPKPLRYQLQAERPEEFSWEPQEEGPEEWVIRIGRVAEEE